MLIFKHIVKSQENEELYKLTEGKKSFFIELVKGEELTHLWTHLLTTADAILYIIFDEAETKSNVKYISELLLDERTSIIPFYVMLYNKTGKADKKFEAEMSKLAEKFKSKREHPVFYKSLSAQEGDELHNSFKQVLIELI